jgi:hypothetical protein
LYAAFPRPKAAFASSRRAAAWAASGSVAAAAGVPPGNGSIDVISAASVVVATIVPVLPIAVTITRAHVFTEYPLALLVHASVPFCAPTSAFGCRDVATEGERI